MGHMFSLVHLYDTNVHSVTFCGKLVLIAWYFVENRTNPKLKLVAYFKTRRNKKIK